MPRREVAADPTSVPPDVKTMSSGRPPTILARLSRALPMSSFAFLPAGRDPAAPPWALGTAGARPGPGGEPSRQLPRAPTCRVGAAGVAPGLAHGVPHGLGRLGGQRGGGVVVQVDPPVGSRRRVRGGRARQGGGLGARRGLTPPPRRAAPPPAPSRRPSLPTVSPSRRRRRPVTARHRRVGTRGGTRRPPYRHGAHQSAPSRLPHRHCVHQ